MAEAAPVGAPPLPPSREVDLEVTRPGRRRRAPARRIRWMMLASLEPDSTVTHSLLRGGRAGAAVVVVVVVAGVTEEEQVETIGAVLLVFVAEAVVERGLRGVAAEAASTLAGERRYAALVIRSQILS